MDDGSNNNLQNVNQIKQGSNADSTESPETTEGTEQKNNTETAETTQGTERAISDESREMEGVGDRNWTKSLEDKLKEEDKKHSGKESVKRKHSKSLDYLFMVGVVLMTFSLLTAGAYLLFIQ